MVKERHDELVEEKERKILESIREKERQIMGPKRQKMVVNNMRGNCGRSVESGFA